MTKRAAFLAAFAVFALPLFAGGAGEQDPAAPFNDHALVAVHRIHLREVVRIGVSDGNAPFSFVDGAGAWQGYDVYFARRIAREILGNKDKYLRLVPLTAENWADKLEADEVDIVLGFAEGPATEALADFALPYRRDGAALIAPAVRSGNGELVLWLNDVMSRRLEADFFRKDWEETLRPVYGSGADPGELIIERGGTE